MTKVRRLKLGWARVGFLKGLNNNSDGWTSGWKIKRENEKESPGKSLKILRRFLLRFIYLLLFRLLSSLFPSLSLICLFSHKVFGVFFVPSSLCCCWFLFVCFFIHDLSSFQTPINRANSAFHTLVKDLFTHKLLSARFNYSFIFGTIFS